MYDDFAIGRQEKKKGKTCLEQVSPASRSRCFVARVTAIESIPICDITIRILDGQQISSVNTPVRDVLGTIASLSGVIPLTISDTSGCEVTRTTDSLAFQRVVKKCYFSFHQIGQCLNSTELNLKLRPKYSLVKPLRKNVIVLVME